MTTTNRNAPPATPTRSAHTADAAEKATRRCGHWSLTLCGSEENGVASIKCDDCGAALTRRWVDGKPVYEEVSR